MKYIILILIFVLSATAKEKEAFAVWDKTCFEISEKAEAFAPMVNGVPDLKNVRFKGLVLPAKCMHYELR